MLALLKRRLSWALIALAVWISPILALPTGPNAFDVVVIGGGPAGLSATSGLARVRRNVLMLDSGEYRNGQTRHMHDVIGNDGMSTCCSFECIRLIWSGTVPSAFRALARGQIMRYPTAHMMNGTVTNITGSMATGFTISTRDAGTFNAKKIVLATGMKDVMPSTPGIAENWGKGIYWCPWCDGYEHRDQPYGIFGAYSDVLSTVFEVHTLESDIIALVNGTNTPDVVAKVNSNPPTGYSSWEEKLEAYNIKIDNRTISYVTRLQDGSTNHSADAMTEYDEFRVTFTDGSTLDRSAFIANFPSVQASNLGANLGIPFDNKQHLKTDFRMESIMKGVFVIGDANADNSTNVPHAMWSGKRAAVQIHIALEEERSDTLVHHKRELGVREEEVDALMGRDLREIYDRLMWS